MILNNFIRLDIIIVVIITILDGPKTTRKNIDLSKYAGRGKKSYDTR